MALKQLTVFVENKQGTVVAVTDALAAHDINIRALSIAETDGFGILRLIVNDEEKAEKLYYAECLRIITENTARFGEGCSYISVKLSDILNPKPTTLCVPETK